MSTKTFDDFVKRRVNEAQTYGSSKDVDWDKTREDWICSLNSLYSDMENYLKKYTEADQIQIARKNIQISEDYLGSYEAEMLTLQIGYDKVVAKPIGRLMIGAAGRVDLTGARGTLRLVLLEKGGPAIQTKIEIGRKVEEETGWHPIQNIAISEKGWYIATLPPRISVTALTADAFRDALMELSDV